jgi:hypothetical protein
MKDTTDLIDRYADYELKKVLETYKSLYDAMQPNNKGEGTDEHS